MVAAAIGAMYGSRKAEPPLAVAVRDRLGEWLRDEGFAAAFGTRGRPGWPPSRLALVTVLQRAENLTDRMAAEEVRTRLDWKYLLGLALEDPGFDHSVLAEFRGRVADAGLEQAPLDALLGRMAADGLVRAGGKQRTDSTHVVAAVAALNRLELAGESVRAAAEALTAAHPDWTGQVLHVGEWARRYGTPLTGWQPPVSKKKQDELAVAYAKDGYALLEAVYDKASPAWLAELPAVDVLRRVLLQNYTLVTRADGTEVIRRREKEPEGDGLPPGRHRIASPYDTDARWGAKRDERWLGYKLHVSETCDDVPACGCGPGAPAATQPGAAPAFPNLITHVATTDATVTDNRMTTVIDDALAAKELAPGLALPRFRLPVRRPGHGRSRPERRHRAHRPAAGRYLRPGPRGQRLRPRRLHHRRRHPHRHLPARQGIGVVDAVRPARHGRDRGAVLRPRLRPLPGPRPVHQREAPPAHPAAPRPRRSPGRRPRCREHDPVPGRLRPPRRRRGHHAPGHQPRRPPRPLPRPAQNPPRPRYMACALNLLRLHAYWTGTRWTGGEPATWPAWNSASLHYRN